MRARRATTRRVGLLPKRDRSAEKGLTLIELLVTVVILGLSFVVVIGGISTAILGSDYQKRQVSADAILRTSSDEVRSTEVAYVDCATTYPIPGTDPAGYVRNPVKVLGYWDQAANKFVAIESPAICQPDDDDGLQLLELSVTANARTVTETMQVVKRRP